MRETGRFRRTAAVVLVAAAALAAGAGCEALDDLDPTSTGGASPAVPVGNPGGCGGQAVDLDTALRIITDPIGCPGGVNTLWAEEIGATWTPPTIIEYHDGELPPIACATADVGPDDFASNALYCPLDDTVAYSVEFMAELYEIGGAEYPLFVLLHELGHRASELGGTVGVVSRGEENQADCIAGYETRFAERANRMDIGDALEGGLLFFELGDSQGGWFTNEGATDPGAHGTPRQRAQSFAFGYLRDLDVCHRLGQSPTGSVLF